MEKLIDLIIVQNQKIDAIAETLSFLTGAYLEVNHVLEDCED